MRAHVLEAYLLQYKDPCLVLCRCFCIKQLVRAFKVPVMREVKYYAACFTACFECNFICLYSCKLASI